MIRVFQNSLPRREIFLGTGANGRNPEKQVVLLLPDYD